MVESRASMSTITSRRSTSFRPARANRSSCSRTNSKKPTPCIWRRTKTAKARPSVGTCSKSLKPKVPVHRLVFHEITKDAIQAALASPRSVDEGLVRAQETRRILDRLYGYEVSPLLWRKVRPKLSAGRVQSVAVRLIVERERERMAFVSATWWDLIGKFAKTNQATARSAADDRSMAAAFPPAKISTPPPASSKIAR